jgi:hypothetical protein
MDALPLRLLRASRLLFVMSGLLIGAGLVCVIGGNLGGAEIADRLLARLLAEVDPDTLAALPPDFLTAETVTRAATALGVGMLLLGAAQLATSIGLRRGQRWSYAAAVVGGLFVAITAGATAVFMIVAIPSQPQATIPLVVGAALLAGVAILYGAIAIWTASGRRALETSMVEGYPV